MKDMRRKQEYGVHMTGGSSDLTHLIILEGKVCGKKPRGRSRLTWINVIIKWTDVETYEKVKRVVANSRWKIIFANLLIEDNE